MPPPAPRPTHFLCIPLVSPVSQPQLHAGLSSLRDAVLANPAMSASVPLDAIRPLGTLHLTLGVMHLASAGALAQATAALAAVRPREILAELRGAAAAAAPHGPLRVSLVGLQSMQADVRACSVLYAVPRDAEGLLGAFCGRVRAEMVRAGVVQEDSRGLLLHATVVNTVYVKGQGQGQARGRARARGGRAQQNRRLTMDAEELLQLFEREQWCRDVPIDRIAICRMGAKKVGGDKGEEYEEEGHIEF